MRFLKKIALNFWHTKNLKIKLWVVGWKNWWNNCLSKCVKIILTRLHQKNVKKVKSWKFSAEWEWSTAEKYPIFSTFYISRTKGCQKKLISCHKVLKKCYNNTKISGQSENFSAVLHQGEKCSQKYSLAIFVHGCWKKIIVFYFTGIKAMRTD